MHSRLMFLLVFLLVASKLALAQSFLMADGVQWETCSGTFFDSGGGSGDYANNESLTATLCPTGGPGAGPLSSITFGVWNVQAGNADLLVVHDGPDALSPVLATGSGAQSLLGLTFTSSDVSGCLTFVWTSDGSTVAAGWSASINNAPDAGGNGSVTMCSTDPDVDLFTRLTGTPDLGGQWTFGGNLVSNIYSPGTSPAGVYTYTVPGVPPCPNGVATVTVIQVSAANAGDDRSISVCSTDLPFDMRTRLLGTPQSNGSWSGPSPVVNNTFNPLAMLGGVYTYTVTGNAPCATATADLDITLLQAPDAGSNGSTTVCSTDAPFDLFSFLGGTPDAGGIWTATGNTAHGSQFVPGTDVAGVFTYTVAGQAPCVADLATVTVTVQTAPFAGNSTSGLVCSNGAPVNMKNLLGTGLASGTWSGPSTVAANNLYIPSTMNPGIYTYTVPGSSACANATATVNMSEIAAPNAGTDGVKTACSNGANVDLFSRLGGSPGGGGTWADPASSPFPSGVFVPGTNTPGIYTYTLPGTFPCANDVSIVTITQVQAPSAGINGAVSLCSNSSPDTLFNQLTGIRNTGGIWYKPGFTGTIGGVYNPVVHFPGVYTYVVLGTAPCTADSATVTVTEILAPNAGVNGSLTLCSTSAPANLISSLSGSPNGSGAWFTSANVPFPGGSFNPAGNTAGVYNYIVTGTTPCANDTGFVTVNVNQAPNAGQNGSTSLCSNASPVSLLTVLLGSPSTGGTWTGPSAVVNDTFNPGTMLEGQYTYTKTGLAPCLNATATATVNVERLPVAGGNGSVTLCSNEAPLDLLGRLTGSPDPGGTWNPPPTNGVYDPEIASQGLFTYTVAGVLPCPNATATVTVTENVAPDAGTNGDLTICTDAVSVDLFTGLGGTPDAGGIWSPIGSIAPGVLSTSTFILNGAPQGDYLFKYDVPGIGSCPAVQSEVEVEIVGALNAGSNGLGNTCRTNTQYNLFNALGSNPQQGGVWSPVGNAGVITGSFLNATSLAAGTYTFRYILAGSAGCNADTAFASVTIVAAPFAGNDTSHDFCSNDGPTPLFAFLSGAQTGGTWRKQGVGGLVSGTYNPPLAGAMDSPGVFFYIVSGGAFCAADTGKVTVTETPAPNAGNPTTKLICEVGPPFNMTAQLNGTNINQTGEWTSPNGQQHSATFIPGQDPCGTYSYRVQGSGGCADAISTLTIDCSGVADPGFDGDTTVCGDGLPFLLFTVLNGTPDQGGVFTDLNGVVVPGGSFNPAGASIPGTFKYKVSGEFPCPADSAFVLVTENPEANAGIGGPAIICPTGGSVELITKLGGTPDPNGTWSNGFDGTYNPGLDLPGSYTYTVAGVAPCGNKSAMLTVTEEDPPNAGVNTSVLNCTSDQGYSMVTALNGAPDLGGDWFLGTLPDDGIFLPQSTAPGVYVYTYVVEGGLACHADTATLTITLNPRADAGLDGLTSVCSNSTPLPLFPFLIGAQSGGTWRKPGGSVHSGIFNPATDPQGAYWYKVNGIAPCISDSAKVTVTVNPEANAGCNGLGIVCSNSDPVVLTNLLGCNPSLNGTWSGPPGHQGIYIPTSDNSAVFTYTVAGIAPCLSASSSVQIIENQQPQAGNDAVLTVCSDEAVFTLFSQLTGSPNATGVWYTLGGTPMNGVFDPGSSLAGGFNYVVTGAAPCINDTSRVTVFQNTAPEAGVSTAVTICISAGQQVLIDLLGGAPDATGVWKDPLGMAHGPFFDPLEDPAGTYSYRVSGIAPCGNDSATVTISLANAPDAGDDSTMTVCISEDSVVLFNGLGGTPQTGGVWTGANQVNGIFNATLVPLGTYNFTYTVNGNGTCPTVSATVSVNVTSALDAGLPASATVCAGATSNLFPLLGGTPQTGGLWRDLDGTSALTGDVLNASVAGIGTWHFRYVLFGTQNCSSDSALLTVTVVAGPNAGIGGGTTPLCSSAPSFNLITLLGGTPDANGSWFGPGFVPHSDTLNPAVDPSGIYTYVVPALAGCPPDSAQVTVVVSLQPNAGQFGTLSICETSPAVDLFDYLNGTPDPGGSWTYNGGAASNMYNPLQNSPGSYTYTVTPSAGACGPASANVLVAESAAPFAGDDNVIDVCSSAPSFTLISELSNNPQSGGTWKGPGQLPHGPSFDPLVDVSGVYTYTLSNGLVCPPDSAKLTVNLTIAPDAGADSTLSVCATDNSVDLFLALGSDADTGGTWTDVNGVGSAFVDGVLDASLVTLNTYVFIYTVQGSGPCLGDVATITVTVGAGLDPGIGGTDTICGGNSVYSLFNSLGGTPSLGGIWSEGAGNPALDPETGDLDATQLVVNSPYLFSYTVTDPGCGTASALLNITVSPYPDPGGDTTITLCFSPININLFSVLPGNPQPGGTWTTSGGTPVSETFDPSTQPSGTYLYNLPGTAPCADTSSAVTIIVNQPADAGNGSTLQRCNIGSLNMNEVLSGGAQTGGIWELTSGTAVLNGALLTLNALQPGPYGLTYTVNVPGCVQDVALFTVNVVGPVNVTDTVLTCNVQDRTYTVMLALSGGEPSTYSVTGLDGAITLVAPYVFTSVPIFTSEPFSLIVTDANDCAPRVIEGVTPCLFDDDVFIPESFTPNGDGVNDLLVIPGIEGYPNNTIDIFNRWGAEVFSAAGYDNSSITWDGTSSSALIPGELPTGTYYFVLELGNGSEPYKGFIYLNR
ncbi:MAG: gliding motility-associated C-terminal domain-containing protein [Flavobacteriales bacterium]|nr:gliding motility-associated C-terminal domain-containing protein [Flavobacteriales bacterium]